VPVPVDRNKLMDSYDRFGKFLLVAVVQLNRHRQVISCIGDVVKIGLRLSCHKFSSGFRSAIYSRRRSASQSIPGVFNRVTGPL